MLDYVLSKDVSIEEPKRKENPRIVNDGGIFHWPTDMEFKSDASSKFYNHKDYFTETIFGLPGQIQASDVEKLFNLLTSMKILDDDIETKLIFLARYSGQRIPHLDLRPIIWRMPDAKVREKALAYLIHMTAGGDSKFVKGAEFFFFEDEGKEVKPNSRVMGPAAHRWKNRRGHDPNIRRTQFEKILNKFLDNNDLVVE